MKYCRMPSLFHLSCLLILLGALPAVSCSSRESIPRDEHGDEEQHEEGEHKEGENGHGDEHDEHEEGRVILSADALKRITLKTEAAGYRALPSELMTTGEVGFNEERLAHVTPRIPGRVQKIVAFLGEEVDKGQPLALIASIELADAQAAYLEVKAQAKLAQATLAREEALFADKITSEQDVQEARAAAEQAEAALNTAYSRLRMYGMSAGEIEQLSLKSPGNAVFSLRSPQKGTIVEKHITTGELVSPDDMLFVIADTSRLWIWLDIPERNLADVHLDDDVRIQVEAYPDTYFQGKVAYIAAEVDRDTRTIRARIDVSNPEGELKAGMFSRVWLRDPHDPSGRSLKENVLAVPSSAIQRSGSGFLLFVEESPGRFERRRVTIGTEAGGYTEILTGLQPGEKVVTEGGFLLKSEAARESMGGGHSH